MAALNEGEIPWQPCQITHKMQTTGVHAEARAAVVLTAVAQAAGAQTAVALVEHSFHRQKSDPP